MVVAKHDASHDELARQFHDREVEKNAWPWSGAPCGRGGGSTSQSTRSGGSQEDVGARAAAGGRDTHRRRRTLRARLTLARVAIHTGRTHQIRVHLSAIGHPVVGDSLYGGVRRRVPGDLRAIARLDRPFLHAARLAFKHPVDGRQLEFTSVLPDDLERVLDDLRSREFS